MSSGFTLFPDKVGEQLTTTNGHNDRASEDIRDPAQVEAALNILSRPQSSSVTTNGITIERPDINSRALTPEEGKRRTQYFQDQFWEQDSNSGRDRLYKESPIIAELRTNVIVKDEYTLVTDMSYHLSTRFARSESSIMVNIDHSACLLLAGSFEPAYVLTISALPVQIQPTTNKRNAALIQSFMAEALCVPPERGILRFISIPEENLASNGNTVYGEIERLQRMQSEDSGLGQTGHRRSYTRGQRKSTASMKRQTLPPDPMSIPEHEVSHISSDSPLPHLASPLQSNPPDLLAKRNTTSTGIDRRKSTNGASKDVSDATKTVDNKRKSQGLNSMPNLQSASKDIPQAQKISKRKSFLAVLRRL